MPDIIHLDFETVSACDLRKYGAWRYSSDPSTRILLCAVGLNDEPVLLWDAHASDEDNAPALALIRRASADPSLIIWGHNVSFEMAVSHYNWERTFGCPPPKTEQWRCTMVLTRVAAIPQSLGDAADFLKLDVRKDKAGKALIQKFSVPQKVRGKPGEFFWIGPDYDKPLTIAGEKVTARQAWAMFRDYCIVDVDVERRIHKKLKPLELTGWVLDAFLLDGRLNARGVPVNLGAVDKALAIIDDYTARISGKFTAITGLRPSQGKEVLKWMKDRGYPKDDLTIGSVTEVLTGEAAEDEDADPEQDTGEAPERKTALWQSMTPEAVEALTIRSLVGYAALKKLPTMKNAVCPDGRVRGMFKFWGAIRTGRYASTVVQLQNLKRPTDVSETVFEMIAAGQADADIIDMLFGSPLHNIAGAIRHFVGFEDGRKLIGADFSQIEARVLPWMAGQDDILQAFREGKDLYKVTAAGALGKRLEEVTKADRQLGKVLVLACGYAGGLGAMATACAMYGIEMPDKEKRELVKAWRKANPAIVEFWGQMSDAAVEAILKPGKWVKANSKIRFGCTSALGYPCLVMELPSGRKLSYPYPQVEEIYKIKRTKKGLTQAQIDQLVADGEESETKEWVTIPKYQAVGADGELFKGVWLTHEISYYGPIKNSVKWGRVRTHGGVFVENAVQGNSGDYLMLAALNAEKDGFEQILTVHDELGCEHAEGQTEDMLVSAMCRLPSWAPDFPLEAVGGITNFYTK